MSWRNTLLWADIPEAIDVDYWLEYAKGSKYSRSIILDVWYSDPLIATTVAIKEWNKETEEDFIIKIPSPTYHKILKFAKDFIEVNETINGNIIIAYITQETFE